MESVSFPELAVDIQDWYVAFGYCNEPTISDKLRAMDIYASELGEFPFPRSHEEILALATLRGAASGFKAAEAFELLRERA